MINFAYLNSMDWKGYIDDNGEYFFRSRNNNYDMILYLEEIIVAKKIFFKEYGYFIFLDITNRENLVSVVIDGCKKEQLRDLYENLMKELELERKKILKEVDLK